MATSDKPVRDLVREATSGNHHPDLPLITLCEACHMESVCHMIDIISVYFLPLQAHTERQGN